MIKTLNTLSPTGKKWISTYNATHHPTDITRCERVWVCGCAEGGGGGWVVREEAGQEKVMVNYQPAEEGPCGENLKILPSSGDLNPKDLPVGK